MPNPAPFTAKLLQAIQEKATSKTVAKGSYIIKAGDIEQHLYFIETGAVRVFYLTEFEEHTIRLGYTGSIINSLSSFIKGTPSEFYIEALRKTELKVISKTDLRNLIHSSEENMRGYIDLIELLVTQQIEREIDLLITSPTERLERVLQRSPNVFQEIPLKYIASYLRMKPETLSRIRKS
ncbi:MAG TPA: Crp/Fnr family transcriptional regulator [Flavobacteriales bacterium]|nr:Crp/Fnr family transcriptional regulator [Flavobacteriales bacterium]